MNKEIIWHKTDGSVISCHEKVKVLNENYQDLKELLQDMIDDALLLGCSESSVRGVIQQLVTTLKPRVLEQNKPSSTNK